MIGIFKCTRVAEWLSICVGHVWWCRFITCVQMSLFGGIGRRLSLLGPSLVGVSSSTSEAVPWKVTPGSECVVLPDTPTCLLPSPVGVLQIQLTVQVVRLACE